MEILKSTLNLKKRECNIKMRLVPYGGGWTHVYVSFDDSEEFFFISGFGVDNLQTLLRALYFLYPDNNDNEYSEHFMEYKYGIIGNDDGVITKVVDIEDSHGKGAYCPIPWKTQFAWTDDINSVTWYIERTPDTSTDFDITIKIDDNESDESKHYEYTVPYKDMCYAVADACTKAIIKHGFRGYHASTYSEDMNIRYLLFIKSIALGNMDALNMYPEKKGEGPKSDLMKELELLLFDMS